MAIYKELFKPAPCDECPHYNKCGDNLLACSDFVIYVGYGEIVNVNRFPTAELYGRIYGDEEVRNKLVRKKAKKTLKVNLTVPLWKSQGAEKRKHCKMAHSGRATPFLNDLTALSESQDTYKKAEAY